MTARQDRAQRRAVLKKERKAALKKSIMELRDRGITFRELAERLDISMAVAFYVLGKYPLRARRCVICGNYFSPKYAVSRYCSEHCKRRGNIAYLREYHIRRKQEKAQGKK